MKGRKVFSAVGLLLLALALAPLVSAKEETVTLEVTGMTWGGCASAVQAALEEVKGVKEVEVSLAKKEAVVKYDAEVAKVDGLIKAVKEASGPHGPYEAKVKKN